jgi:hypothetical protein
MASYLLGQSIVLEATFTGADDVTPADPDTVTLVVESPSGQLTTYQYGQPGMTNPDVGLYRVVLQSDEVGHWRYSWSGQTDDVRPTAEQSFWVHAGTVG